MSKKPPYLTPEQSAAEEAAGALANTTGGALRRRRSLLEGVMIAMGKALAPLTKCWSNRPEGKRQ
jgi:hypothetical protein